MEQLAKTFKDGLSENTRRAYAQDLRDCAHFLARHSGEVDPHVSELPEGAAYVARKLLPNGQGMANALVIGYRSYLGEKGRAPATVNRRLAAVRSLVKAARLFGIVTWKLEVSSVRSRSYRDTSGRGLKGFKRMMAKARPDDTAKGVRDRAILRPLWDLALRRSEVVGLDVEDVDLERGRLMVHGEGRGEPELMTLPDGAKAALGRWLEVRGEHDGALFTNFDRASKGDGAERHLGLPDGMPARRRCGREGRAPPWHPARRYHARAGQVRRRRSDGIEFSRPGTCACSRPTMTPAKTSAARSRVRWRLRCRRRMSSVRLAPKLNRAASSCYVSECSLRACRQEQPPQFGEDVVFIRERAHAKGGARVGMLLEVTTRPAFQCRQRTRALHPTQGRRPGRQRTAPRAHRLLF